MMSLKLLYKWLIGFINKPLTILKSIYYRIRDKNKNTDRLTICIRCKHKQDCKLGAICDICGCILDNKTRIKEEHCELNKW